jgi:hypothetical protein
MADTRALGARAERRRGSSPLLGTKERPRKYGLLVPAFAVELFVGFAKLLVGEMSVYLRG